MKLFPRLVQLGLLSVLACASCAPNPLKQTWKAPEHSGPVGKVALIAVDERPVVRKIFEGQFATQLEKRGHGVVRTYEHMGLEEMKANREATAARLKELGADAVVIVRLASQNTYARDVRATRSAYVPVTTGFETYGWYSAFDIAYMDMGTTYSSVESHVMLETSLFDLTSGKAIWSGVTKTVVRENTDKLEQVRPLVSLVMDGMSKDGVIK